MAAAGDVSTTLYKPWTEHAVPEPCLCATYLCKIMQNSVQPGRSIRIGTIVHEAKPESIE